MSLPAKLGDDVGKMEVEKMARLVFRKVVKNGAIAYKIVADKEDKLLIDAIESFAYANQYAKELDPYDLVINHEMTTDKNVIFLLYRYRDCRYVDVDKKDIENVAEMIKERYKKLQKEEEYTFDF